MIEFKCSECGKKLKVAGDAAGKRGKCPQCGAMLRVPARDRPAALSQAVVQVEPSPASPAAQPVGGLGPKQAYHNALLSSGRACGRRAQPLPTDLSAGRVAVLQLSFRHPRPSLSSGLWPTRTGTSVSRRQRVALNTAAGAAMLTWCTRHPRRVETPAAMGSTPANGRPNGHRFEPPDTAREQTHSQNA